MDHTPSVPGDGSTDRFRHYEFFEGIIEHSTTVFYLCRFEPGYPYEYISRNIEAFGYDRDEFLTGRVNWRQIVFEDDLDWLGDGFTAYLEQERISESLTETYRVVTKEGEIRWVFDQTFPVWDDNGKISHVQGMLLDITSEKELEQELRHYKQELESLVKDRTKQLEEANRQLTIGKLELEQKQIALQEVLKQIETQNRQIKRDIAFNVEKLLLPVLRALKERTKHPDDGYVTLVENTAKEIATSFGRELASELVGLTPREIEVCNLVRNNLTSKEIADLLCISANAVDWHRYNIRRKFGILGKKVNLVTYLHNLA